MSLRRTLIVITPDQVDAANRAVAASTLDGTRLANWCVHFSDPVTT